MSADQLEAYVDNQYDELIKLVRLEEKRTLHLVDLKEAFLTASAAEKIAEISAETERLQEEMASIDDQLAVLGHADPVQALTAHEMLVRRDFPPSRLHLLCFWDSKQMSQMSQKPCVLKELKCIMFMQMNLTQVVWYVLCQLAQGLIPVQTYIHFYFPHHSMTAQSALVHVYKYNQRCTHFNLSLKSHLETDKETYYCFEAPKLDILWIFLVVFSQTSPFEFSLVMLHRLGRQL